MEKLVLTQSAISAAFEVQGIYLETASSDVDFFTMYSWGQKTNYTVKVLRGCVVEIYRRNAETPVLEEGELIFRCKVTVTKITASGRAPKEIRGAIAELFGKVREAWDVLDRQASSKNGSYLSNSYYSYPGSEDKFFPTGGTQPVRQYNDETDEVEIVDFDVYTHQKTVSFPGAVDYDPYATVEKTVTLDQEFKFLVVR